MLHSWIFLIMIMWYLSVTILVAGSVTLTLSDPFITLLWVKSALVIRKHNDLYTLALVDCGKSSQYSDRNHVTPHCLYSCTFFRWRHTTQRGRVTRARWSSSSQSQTGPAVPAGLSSEEESCPTASRWPGVSFQLPVSWSKPFILTCSWRPKNASLQFCFPHWALCDRRWIG